MADHKTLKPFPQFLLLTLLFPIFAAKTDTITITSPIRDPDSIVCADDVFQLGFFSPAGSSGRYLAVFYTVSNHTTIWIANRANPLPDSSGTAAISDSGDLILLNGKNDTVWATNISSSPTNIVARILAAGNLVLMEVSTGKIMWDSFSFPTNVYLPTMRLTDNVNTGQKIVLSSWKNETDPDTGPFTLGLQARPLEQIFIWHNGRPRWRSGPWNGRILIGIEDMYVTYLTFKVDADQSGNYQFTFAKSNLLPKFVLNSTGGLLQTFWEDNYKRWDVTWQAFKHDCDLYAKCGPFGVCDINKSRMCACLAGFEPKDKVEWGKGNWTGGCERRTVLECNNGKGEGFLRVGFMKVPDFGDRLVSGNEGECTDLCWRNCSCIAYAYEEGIGCMVWRDTLVDLQRFSSVGSDLYVRLPASELDDGASKKLWVIVIPIAMAIVSMSICGLIIHHRIAKKRGMQSGDGGGFSTPDRYSYSSDLIAVVLKEEEKLTIKDLPFFTYEMLLESTNQFHNCNMVGKGGFGLVYKGRLANGKEVAVKRLSRASGQGMEEFRNEVILISKLQHWNLVKLIGCCVENEEKILVYEYMRNKSLDLCLFDPHHPLHKMLKWEKRLDIIEGIGRGLMYLHKDSRLKIIHRDLKPSNVLLDENLNPKISDFGMARIFGENNDQDMTTRVGGTYGYMAPEYAMEGKFSEKTDVYSFGVMMLEIISGKKNTNYYNHEWSLSLIGCAWKMWSQGNGMDFFDGTMECLNFQEGILRCIHVALLCVQEYPKDRPSIQTALSMLAGEITEIPHPEKPVFADKWRRVQVGSTQSTSQSFTILVGR